MRPGGQVLLFGGCAPGDHGGFDAARLHYAEIALIGSFHYTPTKRAPPSTRSPPARSTLALLIAARGTLADLPRFLDAQQRGEGVRFAIMGG